jgi:succinate dehydrogenase / fumarate reductase cytochrome b subunit
MLGNLKVYMGPEHYNEYAKFLVTMGSPLLPNRGALILVRTLLVVALYFHIDSAVRLTMMNRAARPIGYRERDNVKSSYAARTMRWGGIIIFLFVFYHLGHLTYGKFHPNFIENDPYHNFVTGFQVWWASAIYIVANLALGLHLYHGLWAMFNSLGLNSLRFNAWRRVFATAFALIISVANISFPVMVLLGIVR